MIPTWNHGYMYSNQNRTHITDYCYMYISLEIGYILLYPENGNRESDWGTSMERARERESERERTQYHAFSDTNIRAFQIKDRHIITDLMVPRNTSVTYWSVSGVTHWRRDSKIPSRYRHIDLIDNWPGESSHHNRKKFQGYKHFRQAVSFVIFSTGCVMMKYV